MATFVVLPPRELIEHAAQEFAARLLPGVAPPAGLADALLGAITGGLAGMFVLHREDLPDVRESADVVAVLCEAFGAGPGDRVIEVGPPRVAGPASVRETAVSAAPAAR